MDREKNGKDILDKTDTIHRETGLLNKEELSWPSG